MEKKIKQKYNIDFLTEIVKRDKCNIEFINYSSNKLTSKTRIIFVCECGESYEKSFESLNVTGAFCLKCLRKMQTERNKRNTKYNASFLQEIIKRDECKIDELTEDFLNNISKKSEIPFICKCGKRHEKNIVNLDIYGAFCPLCLSIRRYDKTIEKTQQINIGLVIKTKQRYNKDFLFEIIERDKCKINEVSDDFLNNLNRDSEISYKCNCGNDGKKTFNHLNKSGAFCSKCLKNNQSIKLVEKKTGVLLTVEELTTKKICYDCKLLKLPEEFHKKCDTKDGLCTVCKECQLNYKKTFEGALTTLLNSSKSSAKSRKEKGRNNAGEHTITFSILEDMWKLQDNGKCFYSNFQMTFTERNWKLSIERLDQDKGYIEGNVVLCCLEFNGRCQWSHVKIKEMMYIKNQNILDNFVNFNLENKERKTYIRVIETSINEIKHYTCSKCSITKAFDQFCEKSIGDGCKECQAKRNKEYSETPRGGIFNLLNKAKHSTEERNTKDHRIEKHVNDIDFEYLVELFNNQKGLCKYSKIPLQFGSYIEKNWTCSLERIDISKGYIKGNVCLICCEFNTSVYGYKNIYDNEGSSGWTKEKFDMFYESLLIRENDKY